MTRSGDGGRPLSCYWTATRAIHLICVLWNGMNDEPRLRPSPSEMPAVPPPGARYRHGVRWMVVLLVLAAVAGVLYYNRRHGGQEAATAVPAATAKPPPVTVSHPLETTITEWDELPASSRPWNPSPSAPGSAAI
jgi:hypothetical protein